MPYQQQLQRIVEEVVAPEAGDIDAAARFPKRAMEKLAAAGILALTVPQEDGGGGGGLREAADVVQTLAGACGSTAMVTTMHYAAIEMLAAAGRSDVLAEIAGGGHLTTLAVSESGSRAHFWAPLGTAVAEADEVVLDARKSWVTSAHEADSYVWSSRPVSAPGPMTLWCVPRTTPGLSVVGGFDGLGLRGNDSCPVTAEGVRVPRGAQLGEDGAGLELALTHVLPTFLVLNAAMSVGLVQAVAAASAEHLRTTTLEHLGQTLGQQPVVRAKLAQLQIQADQAKALLEVTLSAVEEGRADAQLLVLEVKAACGEIAASASDLAMVVCGGAAFRKDLSIERRFRDARAARVMAPTTDALHDFVGRALLGQPLFD